MKQVPQRDPRGLFVVSACKEKHSPAAGTPGMRALSRSLPSAELASVQMRVFDLHLLAVAYLPTRRLLHFKP